MSRLIPPTVEVQTTMRLVTTGAETIRVAVTLRYEPTDPYAVHLLFPPDCYSDEPIPWKFGRDLLVGGLDEPAGIGDVRVWPYAVSRGEFVALAMTTADGNMLFEVPRSVLVRFLRRTYAVVPRGRESELLDVDACISVLLAGGAR